MNGIFIVIYGVDRFPPEEKHWSFEGSVDAKNFAIEKANDSGGLVSILRVDTVYKTVSEYELVLDSGRFELREKRKEDK